MTGSCPFFLFFFFLFMVAILFLFSGCAVRQPLISHLSPSEEQAARVLFSRFVNIPCPDFIDIDLTATWRGYGQQRTVRLGLQAARDGRFRVSGFDPLSRPFFIFVTDGYSFTMVDNRRGRGYTGSLDSEFIHEYLPEGISGKTMFLLLAGRFPDDQKPIVSVANDSAGYYRYIFSLADGYFLHGEISIGDGLLSRQFVVDKNDEIIIAVRYDGEMPVNNACPLPLVIGVEGEGVTGTVRLVVDKVYDYDAVNVSDDVFLLRIPEHFTVTAVE